MIDSAASFGLAIGDEPEIHPFGYRIRDRFCVRDTRPEAFNANDALCYVLRG